MRVAAVWGLTVAVGAFDSPNTLIGGANLLLPTNVVLWLPALVCPVRLAGRARDGYLKYAGPVAASLCAPTSLHKT